MTLPNYLRVLAAHLAASPELRGKVGHVEIRHDDFCAHWLGRPCNCNPQVLTGPAIDRKYEDGR